MRTRNGDAITQARLHQVRAQVLRHEKSLTARTFARNATQRRAETCGKSQSTPLTGTYKKYGISVIGCAARPFRIDALSGLDVVADCIPYRLARTTLTSVLLVLPV